MKKRLIPGLMLALLLVSYTAPWATPPKDTVVIAQGVDPSTLDPQDHYESTAFNVLLNVYETLFQRDDNAVGLSRTREFGRRSPRRLTWIRS